MWFGNVARMSFFTTIGKLIGFVCFGDTCLFTALFCSQVLLVDNRVIKDFTVSVKFSHFSQLWDVNCNNKYD